MAHSFAKLHLHVVFSTKHREPIISDRVREDLHRYMATSLSSMGCPPVLINSVDDHVHLLFELSRTKTVSGVLERIKVGSSKWIKTQGAEFGHFSWQGGYGAFAVSASDLEAVTAYVSYQRQHHKHQSFCDEYRQIMQQHGVLFDETYGWE